MESFGIPYVKCPREKENKSIRVFVFRQWQTLLEK